MRVKLINLTTLDSSIINIKGGTLDEVLTQAEQEVPTFNKTILVENENILLFKNFVGDVIYKGIPKNEYKHTSRRKDWSEKIAKFNANYSERATARDISVKSGLAASDVYYLAKMLNVTLVKGQRGKRR